jgi:hypothetical protein
VIRELVRSQDGKELSLEIDDEDEGRKKSDPPDLKPTPELDAELTESVEIINRFIEKLRKRCQVLIRTAAEEEVKPAEMPLLIGEPNTSAIKISNDLRFCRQTLCKLLQDSGYGDLVPFCRTKR